MQSHCIARQGIVIFLTGYSASGKTTLANALMTRGIFSQQGPVSILDGDEVRQMLSSELGFSAAHRDLNINRLGYVAAEIARHGGRVIVAAIAPHERARVQALQRIRQVGALSCLVYVNTSLEVCERRDPKGLYARARAGSLESFTGVSMPYEVPEHPDLILDMDQLDLPQACERIEQWIDHRRAPRSVGSMCSHGTAPPPPRNNSCPQQTELIVGSSSPT